MTLPANDVDYLRDQTTEYRVAAEAGMTCIVLADFPLPAGYDRSHSALLLRLNPGYPDVPPDMWWFDPPVRLATGASAEATDCTEVHLGKSWQRWSRHLEAGQWKSGVDGLESFLALVRRELARCAGIQ